MKNHLRAALVAIGLVIAPATLLAGNLAGEITATDYDSNVISGITKAWEMKHLRHTPGTMHQFTNPHLFPPGPCRSVAIRWNQGVFTNRGSGYFAKLLDKSAKHNCRITFEAGAPVNADGSNDLVSSAPAP